MNSESSLTNQRNDARMHSGCVFEPFITLIRVCGQQNNMAHKAIYAKVVIKRHLCPQCNNYILTNQRSFICDVCGFAGRDTKTKGYRIIVPPPGIRHQPIKQIKDQILREQDNRCYWCSRKFEQSYIRDGKVKFLEIHWDHKIPFSFEQANRDDNWVASCNICNLLKSSFIFKKEEECRRYLLKKWENYLSDEIIILGEE